MIESNSLFFSLPQAKFASIYDEIGKRLAQLPNSFTGDVSLIEDESTVDKEDSPEKVTGQEKSKTVCTIFCTILNMTQLFDGFN